MKHGNNGSLRKFRQLKSRITRGRYNRGGVYVKKLLFPLGVPVLCDRPWGGRVARTDVTPGRPLPRPAPVRQPALRAVVPSSAPSPSSPPCEPYAGWGIIDMRNFPQFPQFSGIPRNIPQFSQFSAIFCNFSQIFRIAKN